MLRKHTKRMTPEQRYERRLDILEKRDATIVAHRKRGRSFIKYKCGRGRKAGGGNHPFSSDRQEARYRRQIAAGQIG